MLNLINIEDALNLENTIFIDVRSPSEFEEATIPGAANMPVLGDEERAYVGTAYRKENIEKATMLGINYASQKLPEFYAAVNQYHHQKKNIIIFCWRGGMRSKSVCSFLNSLKLNNVYQLVGGYKAYRKYVVNFLQNNTNDFTFIMLHGLTGVGKTYILKMLRGMGEPVLDLEDLANNSGSVFGNITFNEKPPSQKMFESRIFDVLYQIRRKILFVESESKRIGSAQIPDTLYQNMMRGHHILINTSLNNRIEVIKKDYINSNKDDKLILAISHLKKRLGNEKVEELIKRIKNKDYEYVIRNLIEYYYDPLYKYSIEKYKPYDLTINYEEINDTLDLLADYGKVAEKNIERSI